MLQKHHIANYLLLATIGALFYAVGDFKNCELMYVKYVKFIETNFGSDHL